MIRILPVFLVRLFVVMGLVSRIKVPCGGRQIELRLAGKGEDHTLFVDGQKVRLVSLRYQDPLDRPSLAGRMGVYKLAMTPEVLKLCFKFGFIPENWKREHFVFSLSGGEAKDQGARLFYALEQRTRGEGFRESHLQLNREGNVGNRYRDYAFPILAKQ